MNPVDKIINEVFEKEYFSAKGSLRTEKILAERIEKFNSLYPNAVSALLLNLRENMSGARIEDCTQFFNLDRCIRFLIQFDHQKRYVCQVSIFGYFSVYHCPYEFVNDKYFYGGKLFLNPNESEIGNKLYKCATSLIDNLVWLNRTTLNQMVYDFSIPEIDYQCEIKVADLLFTEHYL